jgi:hypothetical protein
MHNVTHPCFTLIETKGEKWLPYQLDTFIYTQTKTVKDYTFENHIYCQCPQNLKKENQILTYEFKE